MKIPKEVVALILISAIIFFGWLVPTTLVLGNQELRNEGLDFTSSLYNRILFGGAMGLILIYALFFILKKNNKYGDSLGFASSGEKPSGKIFGKISQLQLFLLSLPLFSLAFLVGTLAKLGSFTGLRVLPQQFSPLDSLVFSSLIVPLSENMMFAFLLAFTILVLTLIAIKYKLSEADYTTLYYIVPTIIGVIFAVTWHLTAYAGQDYAIFTVAMFWALGGLITLYTGSFIPFAIIHTLNNFFLDFSRLYSSDSAVFTITAVLVILPLAVYYFLYGFKLKQTTE